MANRELALPDNVAGDFFVDETCIDCDTCRAIAPGVFARRNEQSAVIDQPSTDEERLEAGKAAVSCPTSSIGASSKQAIAAAADLFPERISGDVYYCGYTSESSFGASSYLVVDDGGNFMVDSPRFARRLIENIKSLGGADSLLLTHRDDVADHERLHAELGCDRIIHEDDAVGSIRNAERLLRGIEPVELKPGLVAIPVPGHTIGSVVYLWRDEYLFSGDHLAWSERLGHLYAFRGACWYSWDEQIESMERLLDYRFEWVLPGHARRAHLPTDEMHASLERCVEWMRRR